METEEYCYYLALLYTVFGNFNTEGYQEKNQPLLIVSDQFISKLLKRNFAEFAEMFLEG